MKISLYGWFYMPEAIPGFIPKNHAFYTGKITKYQTVRSFYGQKACNRLSNAGIPENADELPLVQNDRVVVVTKTKPNFHLAQAAVRMDLPEGEKLILSSFENTNRIRWQIRPCMKLPIIITNAKKYDEAITFYSILNSSSISGGSVTKFVLRKVTVYS